MTNQIRPPPPLLPPPPGDAGSESLSEDDLGILTVRPCNPQFAIEASRLESYKGKWPSNLPQTPDQLSSAGFFYVGKAGKMNGLIDWVRLDWEKLIPW